ncbi:hypothetical protein CC86DRAFT_135364 [Ophiobolus disseminans]|uniref:Uncharacterized protein n=1 Tax=Ophiobolus disseminans TaxID=1469910 RepID=A0A6A7ACW0_9PLEO|nr:hypothetical protein CC86DRAFT_135364 [Ophiobolus disseminans]
MPSSANAGLSLRSPDHLAHISITNSLASLFLRLPPELRNRIYELCFGGLRIEYDKQYRSQPRSEKKGLSGSIWAWKNPRILCSSFVLVSLNLSTVVH